MTATYTNDPENRPIDEVRMLIDDRDCIPETDALLTDEEITYFINKNSHVNYAAAAACDTIVAKYAGEEQSKQVGDLKVSYVAGGRSSGYMERAKNLRAAVARRGRGKPYAGGISETDKDRIDADTDLVPLVFSVGMDDSEYTGQNVDRGVMDY